MYVLKK